MDYKAAYGQMHERGKYFPGYSIQPYVGLIATLVREFGATRLLDYGCGRGMQYLKRRVHEEWGGILPYCYDIGVRGLDEKPEGPFGGVICTDMLEHIERIDVPGILNELLNYTAEDGFLFLVISCRPSRKKLPGGGDVHVTVEPPSWWQGRLLEACGRAQHRRLLVRAEFDVAGHFDEPEQGWEYRR